METTNEYTISVYAENNIGILNRISAIFLRRHISIESIALSESEIRNVFRFVLIVEITEDRVKKVVTQIEKQVDVIKTYYHLSEETIYQESALYKMKTSVFFKDYNIQKVVKKHNANLVTASEDYIIIEKTGIRKEIESLYSDLEPFEILQFVRSGRISVSKTPMNIRKIIKQ